MRDALDPEVLVALEAIDATLHGEPVDPDLAELAELSLILREGRTEPDGRFLDTLDRRVAERFAAPNRAPARRRRRARGLWWGAGTALACVLGLVVALHLGSGGASSSSTRSPRVAAASAGTSTVASSSSASAASSSASGGTSGSAGGAVSRAGVAASAAPGAKVPHAAPTPRSGRGRDVVQSARIVLRAHAGRIDPVAQEVYDVVGAEHGDVMSSHVSDRAHGAGSARFALRVPSGRLAATLTRLSSLRGAAVTSRTDASSDITATVNTAAARLAAERALHRSLLRRLAAAYTTTEADQLQAAVKRSEAAILADADALAGLHARSTESTIDVTVSAPAPTATRPRRAAAGFTVRRALHDARDVLVVAAGVALIALAVLVPLGLLVALGAWVWALTLRRRREGALGR